MRASVERDKHRDVPGGAAGGQGEVGTFPGAKPPRPGAGKGKAGAVELKSPTPIISHQFTGTLTPVEAGKARPTKSRPEQ